MGALEHAAGGDAGESANHLDGRNSERALADADRSDFTGIVLLVEVFPFPFGGGDGAGDFIGEVDAGFRTEADFMRPVGDLVDAEASSQRIEKDVAGLIDGLVDVDCAVTAADPATLISAE